MKCYHDLFTDSKILCEIPYVNDVMDDYFSGRITPEVFEGRIKGAVIGITAAQAVMKELKRRRRRSRDSVMLTPGKF